MALRQKEDAERLIPKYVHANFEAGSDGIYFLSGNGKIASWGAVVGFVVMMSLDVGLG